jgi:hypothetical protein
MRPTVRPLRRRRRRPCRHRRRRFCRCARVTSSRALYRALQRSKKHANAHNAVTRVCSGAAALDSSVHIRNGSRACGARSGSVWRARMCMNGKCTHSLQRRQAGACAHMDAFRRSLTRLRMGQECDARRDESKRHRCARLAIHLCSWMRRTRRSGSIPTKAIPTQSESQNMRGIN